MSALFESRGDLAENGLSSHGLIADDARQHLLRDIADLPPVSSRSAISAVSQSDLLQKSPSSDAVAAALPESFVGKASVVGNAALGSFSSGLESSIIGVNHISVPLSESLLGRELTVPVPAILQNAAVGAAIGFAARTLLPETGLLGKAGNVLLAGAFMTPVAVTGYRILNDARYSSSTQELQLAGKELGSTMGSMVGGLPVGIGAYKLGDSLGGKFMASDSMATVAKAKADFYDSMNQKLANGLDISSAALKAALDKSTGQAVDAAESAKPALELAELPGSQSAVYKELKPALETYHTAGRSNGGGVDGIQLPPKVAEEQLQTFIHKLSSFLGADREIDVKVPAPGQSPEDFRTQLEHDTAEAVKAHSQQYLDAAQEMIKNPVIKDMIQNALRQAPPEFFKAPSSSSGKYHPADEVNVGGLSLHSLRTVRMGAKLIDFYNQEAEANVVGNQNLVGDQRDMILGSLLVHDIEKGGVPWNKYDPAHGPEGATFLEDVWKDDPHQDLAAKMQELVNNHMAQWNKLPGNIPDPKPPQDIPNQIVSYADYLGSQPHIFVQPFHGIDE